MQAGLEVLKCSWEGCGKEAFFYMQLIAYPSCKMIAPPLKVTFKLPRCHDHAKGSEARFFFNAIDWHKYVVKKFKENGAKIRPSRDRSRVTWVLIEAYEKVYEGAGRIQ